MTNLIKVVAEPTELASVEWVRATLDALLADYVCRLLDQGVGLVGFIQFGSTAKPAIKTESDIDLLIIGDDLPEDHADRYALFNNIEATLEAQLATLQSKGFWLQFSTIVRSRSEALHYSPLYLDMTIYQRTYYSREGFVERLIERTRCWAARQQLVRYEHGLQWYWAPVENSTQKVRIDTSDW